MVAATELIFSIHFNAVRVSSLNALNTRKLFQSFNIGFIYYLIWIKNFGLLCDITESRFNFFVVSVLLFKRKIFTQFGANNFCLLVLRSRTVLKIKIRNRFPLVHLQVWDFLWFSILILVIFCLIFCFNARVLLINLEGNMEWCAMDILNSLISLEF